MRKSSVLVKGLAVFAAAAAVQIGASAVDVSAAAAPLSVTNITVDYENQKLEIGANVKDAQIYYGVATVKTVSKKVLNTETNKKETVKKQVLTVSAWDQYDYASGMQIDLSNLNRAKDNYIQVKGTSTMDTPITIKIPKVATKVQAKFDAVAGTVTMNDITDKKNPVELTGTVEYRTNYSGWQTYNKEAAKNVKKTDLTVYQDRGATLYFRMKAAAKAALTATDKAGDEIRANWDDADALTIYQTKTFPGQEMKVAIGKRANAPAVTPNYLTNVVTIPKTAEYRLVEEGVAAEKVPATWTAAPEAASAKAKTVVLDTISLAKNATLEVRTAATATKPASKIKTLAFTAKTGVPVIYCTANAAENKWFLSTEKSKNGGLDKNSGNVANSIASIRSGDVSKNKVVQDKTTDLVVPEYALTMDKKKTKYTKTMLKLTNNTSDAYDIIVANADTYTGTDLPLSTAKVTATVAAGTVNKKGEFVPKATSVAVKEGQLVFIRKKGVAKTKVWATDYIALGTVKLPAIATE